MRNEKAVLYGSFMVLVALSTVFFWNRRDDIPYHIQKRLHMGKYVCFGIHLKYFHHITISTVQIWENITLSCTRKALTSPSNDILFGK